MELSKNRLLRAAIPALSRRGGELGANPLESQAMEALIEAELARTGLRLRFRDRHLETLYRHDVRQNARALNRITLSIVILLVDAFFLTEIKLAPEIVSLSAALRFGLLTPACLAFVALDWRDKLGRWYDRAASTIALLPTLVVAIIISRTTSVPVLPNLQATPLIQLVVLTSRLDLRHAIVVNLVSSLAYLLAVSVCPIVPANFWASMILTTLCLSIGSLAFALRVDLRERQVFLLGRQAEHQRALMAEQNRALAKLTHSDALTGLGNRRCFDEMLDAAWAEGCARGVMLALVILDIDHFKRYNDSLGHQAGDECLRIVGRAIAQCSRSATDTAARYGGEEFAVILPGASLADGRAVAERLNQAIWACNIAHPDSTTSNRVTASLGVASTIPLPGQIPSSLIEMADACLYAAKHRGRNQVATDPIAVSRDAMASHPGK